MNKRIIVIITFCLTLFFSYLYPCETDFIKQAKFTSWCNERDDKIIFGKANGENGTARYEYNVKMKQKKYYRVLSTVPIGKVGSQVIGTFEPVKIHAERGILPDGVILTTAGGIKDINIKDRRAVSLSVIVTKITKSGNETFEFPKTFSLGQASSPGIIKENRIDLSKAVWGIVVESPGVHYVELKIQLIVKAYGEPEQYQAIWTKAKLEYPNSSQSGEGFTACNGIHGQMIDTDPFDKPDSPEESALLLVNQQLYNKLDKKIHRYIQDLFDEGINVFPYLMDEMQFIDSKNIYYPALYALYGHLWKPTAGTDLKGFIHDVYYYLGMDSITETHKKGLILLGPFPSTFISLQLEDPDSQANGSKSGTDLFHLNAFNDYKNCTIEVSWQTPQDGKKIERYVLWIYDCSNEGNESVLGKEHLKGSETEYTYQLPTPYRGQKKFKFEIQAIYIDGKKSAPEFSQTVKWHFLINPSDYPLADIDGFNSVVGKTIDYMKGENEKDDLGIDANPLLVVLKKKNNKTVNLWGYELSDIDMKQPEQCARTEMYYGRIDAQSLGRAWFRPDIGENIKKIKNWGVDDEVALVEEYLDRNHEWRKYKNVVNKYPQMLFFQSADLGNFGNPEDIYNTWNQKLVANKWDARLVTGCSNKIKPKKTPVAWLYTKKNLKGTYKKFVKDEKSFDIEEHKFKSIEVEADGNGGAAFFSESDHNGIVEVFKAGTRIDDLTVGGPGNNGYRIYREGAKSLILFDCYEMNSPLWDCKDWLLSKLKKPWRLVDLSIHGTIHSATMSAGEKCNEKSREWENRNIDINDIRQLDGDIKFLINNSCENNQFMAQGNMGTNYLFKNRMLAQWGWAGVGSINHLVLHQELVAENRFGAAVQKNIDAYMKQGVDIWRPYFTAVLGDPTIKAFPVFPDLPDLYIHDINILIPSDSTPDKRLVINITVGNKGNTNSMGSRCSWGLYSIDRNKLIEDGLYVTKSLQVGEKEVFSVKIKRINFLPAGKYEFRVLLDGDSAIEEIDEDNNKKIKSFKTDKNIGIEIPDLRGETYFRFGPKIGGLFLKTATPLFIGGMLNSESAHIEFPNWNQFETVNTFSFTAGLFLEYGFNRRLSLETGTYYAEKVIETQYSGWPSYYDKTNFKTIDIPLLLKLNFKIDKLKFFLGGGIKGSYVISIKNRHKSEQKGGFLTGILTYRGDNLVEFLEQRFTFSTIASLGFCLGKFSFEASYIQGLTDITLTIQDDTLNRMVNINAGKFRGIMLLIGYSIK